MEEPLYIVVCDGSMILGAYRNPEHAHVHARTVTGASVVMVQVLEQLPESVYEALGSDFDEQDQDTPVTEVPIEDVEG